ncbi:MAG: transcriptional repressor LexA [Thermoguttaceae bacterium]|jgi:repressor LexA|nr:transcriptional repressor LexA [Thermoguttaceae bacterium]
MEPFENLTTRQGQVYNFIRERIRARGYGPTVREIASRFGINSPNGVMCHLKALEKKGLIRREANMSRAIQLAIESAHERTLPLAGRIAAGVLHEAVEQHERVDFNALFDEADQDLFVLEVSGDSMIDDQIADGDYVIVRRQPTASKGQIVVAITEENEATLKRWFPERNRIRLEPANKAMKPIYVKNARVLGVVVGVVRKVG